jgi:membrane protease YdiL (CAAX protease family)
MRLLREEVGTRALFLSLFVSSFLFLAGAFSSVDYPEAQYGLIFLLLLSAGLIYVKFGKGAFMVSALSTITYGFLWSMPHISTLFLHMSFLSMAAYFLWPQRERLIKGCGSPLKRVLLGVALFFLMIFAALCANAVALHFGIADQAKVVEVVSTLPLYLIILSFTIAPISEELFFRALMVPRIGVPISTILFTLVHSAYGSGAEFIGAFFLGFVLANAYYYFEDPLPCIIAHALFNALSISIMFWVIG